MIGASSYCCVMCHHSDFGVDTLEIVFLLYVLSINVDGYCIESETVAVEREIMLLLIISMKKATEYYGKVFV